MFARISLAMAFVAASISGVNAQSPLGMSSDGILRIDAAEALSESYANIMSLRADWDSNNTSDVSTSSIAGVSSKAATSSSTVSVNASALSEVPLNPDGTINMEAWNTETEAACQKAFASINIATNPSGTGICYNLPALNTTTGVFQADLRLYKISDASGNFASVAPSNIQVQLSYNGASVSSVSTNSTNTTSTGANSARSIDSLTKRDMGVERRSSGVPMLKQYMLVGQIDASMMSGNSTMSMAALEALVMPVLTLSAVGTTGTIKTNVSSNEAVFLNGIFSREVVMSSLAIATWASNEINAELANGTVAFVLPGQQLMIYPIGLVITGLWIVIGVIAYGIGTYDRFMYATNYRRQLAASGPSSKTF